MNIFLNLLTEICEQKMKNYNENSDVYRELMDIKELLEQRIIVEAKLEREV